jgi:acyl carrier protein
MESATESPIVLELRELPRSERREALEELVVAQLRATLLMEDDEELSDTESFFDMGLTSLLIADIKERLEQTLACSISANVLFNSPNVRRLVDHLATDVLAL